MEVRDTGPGMSAEQRGRLFQRFEQAEGALTLARHGGSGLGLAICRELAAAMGGEVTVSSELGRGACFVVELPLRWVAALPAVTPNVARTTPLHDQAPLQLLLVEDDPTVAQVIVGLLQTRGHQVTHVLHGLAALAEVSTRSFDAGLCDLDLPGIDGAALVAQLRARGVRFDRCGDRTRRRRCRTAGNGGRVQWILAQAGHRRLARAGTGARAC